MDNEIDLSKAFVDLWEGKRIIISSALIALLIALGFNFFSPKPLFKATTEIKPISSFQAQPYKVLNSFNFFREGFSVTPENLLSLYVEQLETKTIFAKIVDELGVLQKSDFETLEDYNKAILRFVSKIKILTSTYKPTDDTTNDQKKNYKITFTYNDEETWKKILYKFNAYNKEFIRLEIINRFNQKLLIEKQKRAFLLKDIQLKKENVEKDFNKKLEKFKIDQKFKLEDIQLKKENVKKDFDKKLEEFKIEQKFKLEDIQIEIENTFIDYDKKILNRLAFLEEQKQIARKIRVAKNTVESQISDTNNGSIEFFSTITPSPFYLRGYEAIEEEIKLLKNRDDKSLFIVNLLELENQERALKQDKTLERGELNKLHLEALLELENQERALKQDKTLERGELNKLHLEALLELENQERALVQDKTLERAKNLFAETPLVTKDNFVLANLDIDGTNFKTENNKIIILIVALLIGGFFGVFYVLVSKSINNWRSKKS